MKQMRNKSRNTYLANHVLVHFINNYNNYTIYPTSMWSRSTGNHKHRMENESHLFNTWTFKTVLGKNLTTNYRTTEILNNKMSERKVIFWVVWPNLLKNANGARVLRRPTAAARTDIPETAARRQTVVSGKLRRHSAAGPVLPAARLLLSRERAVVSLPRSVLLRVALLLLLRLQLRLRLRLPAARTGGGHGEFSAIKCATATVLGGVRL